MSAETASNWKQSGNSAARLRLARKPKLRMRTKPRGSRWSRKRRRNSSTGRVSRRCLLAWAESRQHPPLHTLCEIVEQLQVDFSELLPRALMPSGPVDVGALAGSQLRGESERAFIENAIGMKGRD